MMEPEPPSALEVAGLELTTHNPSMQVLLKLTKPFTVLKPFLTLPDDRQSSGHHGSPL